MSFNRPDFLAAVLESLKAQREDALEGRDIHLFQDGARNRYSGLAYARESDIQASIAKFQEHFPNGKVHYTGDNIGVCENFKRAEEYFFRENSFECAYFMEDDMVLSPVYLQMMELLQKYAERMPRVAYFAAYGDYYATAEEIAERRRNLITLDHHWAFGLMRRNWLRMQESLGDYYKIIVGNDYTRRDHRAVYSLYEKLGASPRGTSQDAAKAFACDRLGYWRCRTVTPFARYIGTTGAHMTQEAYDAAGFGKTVMALEPIANLAFPDERQLDEFVSAQRRLFIDVYNEELRGVMAALPARKMNPTRLCTAEDVVFAYRLLLHREPESHAIVERHTGRTQVCDLVRGFLSSGEFNGLSAKMDPNP